MIERLKSLIKKNDNCDTNINEEIEYVIKDYKIEDVYHDKQIIDDKLFDTSKCSVVGIIKFSIDNPDYYYMYDMKNNYKIKYRNQCGEYVMKTKNDNYILVNVKERMDISKKRGYRRYVIEKVLSIEEVKNMFRNNMDMYIKEFGIPIEG